ncbi:MAG TPA: lysophospholipid acyltransferase family protein [Gammaproteobacteria bacterium]|nr:lysophospholipid acyltransferase family protein [Gammaproteobacteria bacterium]
MKTNSCLQKIDLFIRSLMFNTTMAVAIVIYSLLCILSFWLPFRYRYAMISAFTGAIIYILKIICRVDYHVHGLENIPADRVGIVLSKHQSTWETFYLPTIFPHSAIILKRELLWVPFFGWGLSMVDPIAIDRKKKSSAMEQIIKKGKTQLEEGRWIIIFPEGTRIPYGKEGHYKAGGARLAVTTGYPVIPIAHNAGKFWPKRSFIKKPGTVQMVIGPLIETKGRTADQVMTEVKKWIETTIKQME